MTDDRANGHDGVIPEDETRFSDRLPDPGIDATRLSRRGLDDVTRASSDRAAAADDETRRSRRQAPEPALPDVEVSAAPSVSGRRASVPPSSPGVLPHERRDSVPVRVNRMAVEGQRYDSSAPISPAQLDAQHRRLARRRLRTVLLWAVSAVVLVGALVVLIVILVG